MKTRLSLAGSALVVVAGAIALNTQELTRPSFAQDDAKDAALVQEARKSFEPLPKDAPVLPAADFRPEQ